jgi:predicted chitinase
MSDAMKALQTKVGVTADGAFGPNTARAIAKHYGLSAKRAAHLLGQASHESGGFSLVRENLNYSAETMLRVWPSRFKTLADAEPFARNPKALGRQGLLQPHGQRRRGRACFYRQRFLAIDRKR